MKPSHGDVTSSRSCSCTSCMYKSESDRPSFRKLLAHGTRIDKLYMGKFVPLRERNLLGKLVRTRAVYDDIRTQLLSESNLSISDKADLTPRQNTSLARRGKELDDVERSSAILELVDLVDKNAELGSRRLSECCSCCSCGSTIPLHEREGRVHRHVRTHLSSRSSMISKHKANDVRRMGRHMRYKAKHILSDPCTCTSKLSGLIKEESKALIKKLHGNKPEPSFELPFQTFDENQMKNVRKFKGFKIQQTGMGETMKKSLTKLRRSKTKIANRIMAGSKISLEKLRDTEQKLKRKIEDGIRKTNNKVRLFAQQEDLQNYEDNENIFNIRKDSLTKYRENIERKQLQDWECDFECDPDQCLPEKCYKIIRKRLRKKLRKNYAMKTELYQKPAETSSVSEIGIQAENQEVAGETATKSQKIAAGDNNKIVRTIGNRENIEIDNNKVKIEETNVKQTKKKNAKVQGTCFCENTGLKTPTRTNLVKSNTGIEQKISKAFVQSNKRASVVVVPTKIRSPGKQSPSPTTVRTSREAKTESISTSNTQSIEPIKSEERQVVKIGSSFSFSIEFHKDKPKINNEQRKLHKGLKIIQDHQRRHKSSNTSQNITKNAQSGGLALRRCLCTLKLKPNKIKSNRKEINLEASKSVSKSLQTMKLPQLPVKRRKHYTNTKNSNYISRSTPSLTSKSVSSGGSKRMKVYKPNNIEIVRPLQQDHIKSNFTDETEPPRQTVRISSNFSFNIEFYKDGGGNNFNDNSNKSEILPTLMKPEKKSGKRGKALNKRIGHLAHKPSQISSSSKSKYTLTKHNLRRCFCTLKLAKPGKNKVNSYSRGTLTSGQGISTVQLKPEVMDRAIEKKGGKNNVKYALLPYECEPGVCVPGACNPYECLALINKKAQFKTHTRQAGTDHRKTKSTYSTTRKRIKHVKTVNMQSISSSQKNEVVAKVPVLRETKLSPEHTNKQAVRIVSNFSFGIEFYKDKSPSSTLKTQNNKIEQLPKHAAHKTAMTDRKLLGQVVKRRQKSTSAQAKKKEVLVQSAMKRCFCTLKLHQTANNKHNINLTSTGTETVVKEEMYPRTEMASKSTKMKTMVQKLEPYECEPNFCVPGQCDPNQCLERIKIRDKIKYKEFGAVTNTPRTKSTSSATKQNKKGKDAISQSNQTSKQIKRFNSTPPPKKSKISTEIVHKSSSRQAVRIESSFSFNVEFSKNLPKNYSPEESASVMPSKIIKHKGENYRGKPGKRVISQTLEIKKNNQATGIRPMLKRCFCTLKLQNKKKIKNLPTVMPVLIHNQELSTLYREELNRLRDLLSKQSNTFETYSSSLTSMFCSTCFDSSYSTSQKNFKSYRQESRNKGINNFNPVFNSKSIITKSNAQSTLIGVNQYYKSNFYAMNIQVQNKQRKAHKLEPYECEPGICVPGQCNPIECQKLIMKRLMKRASTMTSTEKRSQSISSDTLHSKSHKQQFNKAALGIPKVENEQGFKYKTLPRARTHNKQVVRVGSSFSFNIEFTKNRTTDKTNTGQDSSSSTNIHSKRIKTRSTRGSQVQLQHRTSQSAVVMQHKRSNVSPKIKRCFCTLKLQKKGRQNKAVELEMDKMLTNKQEVVKTADVGQNTKKNKPYSLSNLDPNECEPNVCIPGECDPYVCLERIKRRGVGQNTKDFGTHMKPKKMSASSMTSSQKKVSKGKQANFKEKPIKTVKAPIEKYTTRSTLEKNGTRPARQVVRIGSSFSFDVEFFKDKSFPEGDINLPTNMPSKPRVHKQKNSQKVEHGRNFSQKSIQDSKLIHDQDSQVDVPEKHNKSTKTGSFLKRCFCTAKLQNQKELHIPSGSPSFWKKCLCVFKSMTAAKPRPKKVVKPQPLISETSTYAQTNKIKEKRHERNIKILNLDPYECEPGVCVPGECDPRVCEARIRKRKANLNKMSSTEFPGTRSTSTLCQCTKKSKSTASNAHMRNKPIKTKPHVKRERGNKSEKRSKSSERSAVRIGSNFSFNVEFYKENNPTFENVQKAAKVIKETRHDRVAATETPIIRTTKAKGVDKSLLLHNRESQVDHVNKEDRASGVSLILKRCFCTLALQKHTVTEKDAKHQKERYANEKGIKLEMVTKGTETPNKNFKKYNNTLNNLEPYECEPGVCVPGACDPYECEKWIKKRQRRDSGTETTKHTFESATAMKKDARGKHKSQNIKSSGRHKQSTASKLLVPVKKISKSSNGRERSARQAVRIGSNFSFNIEFSKSRTDGDKDTKLPDIKNDTKSSISQAVGNHSKSPRHKKTQRKKNIRHVDSQVLASKVRSTATEVAPFLKRCFCTLKLKKSEKGPKKNLEVITPMPKIENNEPKILKANKQINTDKVKNHIKTLEPYECEPGICVPGKCNPHECLKRIQKRMQSTMSNKHINTDKLTNTPRTLEPYECEPGICIPGQCDPHECLKRIQKRMQSTMSNTEAPRERKTSTITSKPKRSSGKTTTGIKRRQAHSSEAGDNLQTEKKRTSQSPTKSDKQVVRIGSNFSFNIEFYKENSMHNPHKINVPITNSTEKFTTEVKSKSPKSRHVVSSNQTKLVDRQLQSHGLKTESKASGVGPLMKRCFCTLKLQKVGKLHQRDKRQPVAVKTMKDNSATAKIKNKIEDSRISKDAGTGIKKRRHALEPYECEPNTCIPGMCNPLECYERIKLRNLNEFGTDAISPSMKSVSSLTADRASRPKEIQTPVKKIGVTKLTNTHVKRKADRISHTATFDNQNRQSVRFGSNFNFDIEFSKEGSPSAINNAQFESPSMSDTPVRTPPIKTTSQASYGQSVSTHHRAGQAHVAQESKGSGIAPLLKRCFCTLPLLNTKTNKITRANVSTQNKLTSTKKQKVQKIDVNPNSYEPISPQSVTPYSKGIKKSGIHRQSRTPSINQRRCSKASITPFGATGRYKSIQSECAKISRTVEQPRFPFFDRNKWQGVKIGSNISFNLEFYKENIIPKAMDTNDELKNTYHLKINNKSKRQSMKPINADIKKQDCQIQAQKVKTDNKALIASEALKRCFCTAKFYQKQHENVRVARVDKICTMSPFKPTQYYVYQMKQNGHVCPDDCVRAEMKTVSTKINNKYLDLDPLSTPNNKSQVNTIKKKKNDKTSDVKNAKNLDLVEPILDNPNSTKNKKNHESKHMETILPYAPRKFNKKESKTLLNHENKSKKAKDVCCSYCSCQGQGCKDEMTKVKSKRPKRLTGKDEKMALSLQATTTGLKKFLCTCTQLFSKRRDENTDLINPTSNTINSNTPYKRNADVLKTSKSDRCPVRCPPNETKKTKSHRIIQSKATGIILKKKGRIEQRKMYSTLQSGDAGQRKRSRPKIQISDKLLCPCHIKMKSEQSRQKVQWSDKLLCPCHVKTKGGQIAKVQPDKKLVSGKCNNKCKDNLNQQQGKPTKDPNYALEKNVKTVNTPKPEGTGFVFECVQKLSECKKSLINSLVEYSGQKKSCPCCVCKRKNADKVLGSKKQKEGKDSAKAKGAKGLPLKATQKPCTCGSPKCAKEIKKQKEAATRPGILKRVQRKPCVCGSRVCASEVKKIQSLSQKSKTKDKEKKRSKVSKNKDHTCVCDIICECGNMKNVKKKKNLSLLKKKNALQKRKQNAKSASVRKKKKQQKNTKIMLKKLAASRKVHKKEDAARKKERKKKDLKTLKEIKKYQDTGDCVLLAESVLDIGKLGFKTIGDVLRSTFRTVTGPRRTMHNMKDAYTNPKRACEDIKSTIAGSGVGSTIKRVKLRLGSMKRVQSTKTKLEEYAMTNYLVHIADKDPKKKHQPRKKKKVREPLDFGCSPYMASLRKRPWLSVYYTCPWFYPHCLSMLNVWKQFTDILLFLLAAVVWSPCIILMEAFRAMMCCMFCTG